MMDLFNASTYLLDRHIAAGQGARLALTGELGDLTYTQLHDRVRRAAAGLRRVGGQPEHRLMMLMADSPEFVVPFLAVTAEYADTLLEPVAPPVGHVSVNT